MNFTASYIHVSIFQITLFCWTVMTLYYTEFIKRVWLTNG